MAYFGVRGATKEAVEKAAWEDHKAKGDEEYP